MIALREMDDNDLKDIGVDQTYVYGKISEKIFSGVDSFRFQLLFKGCLNNKNSFYQSLSDL